MLVTTEIMATKKVTFMDVCKNCGHLAILHGEYGCLHVHQENGKTVFCDCKENLSGKKPAENRPGNSS